MGDGDAAAERPGLPFDARCFIAGTVGGATAAVWWLSHHEMVVRPLGTFVALAILAIVLEAVPLTFVYKGQRFTFSIGAPFTLATLTLFGVAPAAVVQVSASLVGDLLGRKSWVKVVFNASQFVLTVSAAGSVLQAALGERIVYPGMSFDLGQMPALVLTLLVFFVVNHLFTGTIVQLVTRWKPREVMKRFVSQESFIEASALLLVPVIAVSMRHNPALGLFLVVPVAALFRATRLAMENVTLLEDRTTALEEKHAADKMAREREAAREAADRANRAKSEFLSHMSHELRTPLNAVLGFAQLLEMDPLTTAQKEGTAEILNAGRHLLELIDELLDISRIEAGVLRLAIEPVNAVDAVEECISLLRPLAGQQGVTLHLEGKPDAQGTMYVAADRQRLKQVVLNLISNGIKYNRPNGSVRVAFEPTGHRRLKIDVTDTGLGIPTERMEQLFTPFERLGAEASNIQGTGLGLALSKGLVEAMGGTISIASELGTGTTFSLELPSAADAPSAAEGDSVPHGQAMAGPSSPATRKVLYIEDNPTNLKLVERLLAQRPEILLISGMTGDIGVTLAFEHRPDLILLDLNLPDLSGEEVLARLQSDQRTSQLPVVVISADAMSDRVTRMLSAGACDYLTKPIDLTRFLQVVDNVSKSRR